MIAADPRTITVMDKINRLPLHIAVHHRPYSKVVGVLLAAYPEGCQVLESLLGSYNASIRIRDGHGLLPKEVSTILDEF